MLNMALKKNIQTPILNRVLYSYSQIKILILFLKCHNKIE